MLTKSMMLPFQQAAEVQWNMGELFLRGLELNETLQQTNADVTRSAFQNYIDSFENAATDVTHQLERDLRETQGRQAAATQQFETGMPGGQPPAAQQPQQLQQPPQQVPQQPQQQMQQPPQQMQQPQQQVPQQPPQPPQQQPAPTEQYPQMAPPEQPPQQFTEQQPPDQVPQQFIEQQQAPPAYEEPPRQ
ncbi:hypothetical protein [Halorarius litoreus]|uniref:hypothetical protein n=1 Tax=Halorarius litoreus TaxID=2962676 RepID=UPI0020CD0118|nr:hypothetical protein [Halorarius litoreus]